MMKRLLRKGSFAISPVDHIYCDFSEELSCLELKATNSHLISLEALLKAFKRKAFLCLPYKHSSLPYAHSRFQGISSCFLRLLHHRLSVCDKSMASILPGQILEQSYEVLVPLPDNTAHLWRQIIQDTYSKVVMEPRDTDILSNSVIERRNSIASCTLIRDREPSVKYEVPAGIREIKQNFNVAGKNKRNVAGKSVSFVVFWKCSEDFGEEIFKISLTVYQKGILQVKGVSYLLWMLDCYPALARMVNMIKLHQEGETFEKDPTVHAGQRRQRRKSL